jgi:putative SOS response-associated peptidase YedK
VCTRYISPAEADIERFWTIGRRNPWPGAKELFPRGAGPFIRQQTGSEVCELVVGQWGLIPWFASSGKLSYATSNARFEEITTKASYKWSWQHGKRCVIPAWTFDEPCWETGKNVWWRFARADGAPWGLAGLWNTWTDKATGEMIESYTMLTINADTHPLMSRMHKPDPKLSAEQQDKRSVVAIEFGDIARWLHGTAADAAALIRPPEFELIQATPQA